MIRLVQILVVVISIHFFVCLFAMGRMARRIKNRTFLVMFLWFGALAVEALTTGLPVAMRLGQPVPAVAIPGWIWARILARTVLSGVTWLAALHFTGVTRRD